MESFEERMFFMSQLKRSGSMEPTLLQHVPDGVPNMHQSRYSNHKFKGLE